MMGKRGIKNWKPWGTPKGQEPPAHLAWKFYRGNTPEAYEESRRNPPIAPGPVRTLADMTPEEIRDLERAYCCRVISPDVRAMV